MSIEASELKLYKSAIVSDTVANGGRMGTVEITSGVATNVFPNVTQSERTAGITRYRKTYTKVYDASSETLYNHKAFIKKQSPADDYVQVKAGTNTDTQAEADDYTGWLGCGKVNASVALDSTSVEVLFEAASGIQAGDKAWLSDGTNEEYLTVSSDSTAVTWVGSTATIILTTGTIYAYNAYTPSNPVWFSGYMDLGDTTSAVDSIVVTTAGDGTFDASYLTLLNKGCVEDTWTITMGAAGAFTAVGTNSGISRAGSRGSTFEPTNTLGDIMFRILSSAWVDTWAEADTLVMDTHHAAKAVWIKEIVPAATASYSNNNPELRIAGESA
jgi:hypothetical protein